MECISSDRGCKTFKSYANDTQTQNKDQCITKMFVLRGDGVVTMFS